ncbi:LPD5 domain-containing protein, partial [uncultured Akkermansia sp.]|uniref:LPD5 domain-containing protein n=1 Tax=uncultured Akkermansia sp. TaxID=512294 RepID=UPI00260E6D43
AGRQSLNDGYAAIWDDFSGKTRKRYADYQQKKAEFQRGLEEFGRELEKALPEAVLQGKTLSPDVMEKATRYGQAEKVTASLQRARAAVDLLRGVNRGGVSRGVHEGAVRAEAERIVREENRDGSYYRFLGMDLGKPKTEEEAEQQARANMGNSYEVTREFISHLVNVLSDEEGQLDEGALGAMMLALDADAQGQQTIDSRFVRNMGEALKRWWTDSDDFLQRYTGKDPFHEFLDVRNALTGGKPLTLEGYLTEKQQEEETRRRLYEDPRVEKLKFALSRLEDTRLSAADKAGFLAGSLTELGTITGDSSPAVLAGLVSGGLSIAAFAPASMNRSIAQAHAEGKRNAELYGLITGGFDALAEGSFGVAVRKVPFVGKLMDKAALGLIGKPVVGKAAAAVQSNWFLRYLGDRVAAESLGELVGEEVISQTGSYLTIQGMRGLGVDMDAPEWKPFSTAWECIQDERQSAATVAYCAALGLMGLSADMRAAREFSRNRENLMTVGLKPETAARLAAMTEDTMNQAALLQAGGDLNTSKLRELDDKLQAEYRHAYETEVVNEDPVKLRDRLKKNHELFMSDIDAQVALKEGVLKAALREQGVLDVEESLTGKNVVTVEDTEQAEKDRASWQDGKMPEGYETPVKKVEWTDEQLAAYSQYAIGNEGLKRMKAIRSAALNLDMAAKVNEKDYARTLPLTESSVPVAAELARSKGAMTIDVLRALSEAAAREGENGRSVLPGVSNAAVVSMEGSFMKRLQWEARSGDTAGASRLLAGEGGAAAIRLTAGEGPASRIVYNPGHTLSSNLAEDVVESMLVDKLRKEGGMDGWGALTDAGKDWLSAMHREMREVRRQALAATGRDMMPGLEKAEPSLMNVTEYFSHLAQSAFYRQTGEYGLNDAAMRHVKFMDSALIQAKFLNDMGAGFAKWADTEAGRAWQKEGGTLAGLLRETGHELADLYTNSRVTAENVDAVEEARMYRRANGTRTVEDIREELEEAGQEGTEAEGVMVEDSREIPAEESVTGETIPAEANEEVPDADPESGQFVPPPGSVVEVDPEGKGRGLEGGRYAEDGVEGSVIGMVPCSSLVFPEWPFSRFAAADGMAEALRREDGRMEVMMGGDLLRQEDQARSVKVRVWDADATRNEAWARGRALEQIALAGMAPKVFSVRDYLEYYRRLCPDGLPDRSALGKLGKKARQAVTILEKAAPEVARDVLSGAVSAADAYAAVETAATQEGQRFYLDQKAADRKASLEYLTALTRAWEAAPGADADALRKQARYVVAARKEIRKAVSRLQDVRGEQPRAVAQRELGIDLPTAKAVADAITRLDLLDASFDAFEADLDVPGRAAEWDEKSPVGVVGSFFQAREEVKEMKAGTEASEAAGRMARKRGRREEQQAQPADEQKPAPDKLEDAGREIKAHKDRYSDRITEPLKAEMPEDFSKVTASKYFPEPDWEKLANDGVSQDVIVAVALIRNLLPDKPRGRKASYFGKEWLNAMKMYRRSTAELLEGSLKPEEFFATLAKQGEKWERQVDLFRGLGYPYCLKAMGMQLSAWTSYPDKKKKWRVERHMKSRIVISGDGDGRMYDTKEEAIEAFRVAAAVQSALENETKQKEGEDGKSEKKRKDVKLTIRYYNSGPKKGEFFICRDLPGNARIKLKDGLASGQEAREYMNEHMDELQEKLRRIARKPDVMLEVSSERVGEDYRNGKNVDNAMLMETFGINGITYGNWVSGPERQAKLNATYDAFLDLAHLLGIPPRAISLNGSLGFQFGASGVGRYSAHYRLNDVSINLTRKKGDGSLAHEWWHALDHYFMRTHAGMNMELASDHTQSRIAPNSARRTENGGLQYDYQYSTPGMNEDAGRAFAELVHAIQRSKYAARSVAMGKDYWGSNIEMTARAFQAYIVKKAGDAGLRNEYLSAYQSKEVFSEIDREFFESTGMDRYPYPTDEEMEKFAPLFDRFFAALTHVRQENGNYVTFSVTDMEDMGAPAETAFSIASAQEQGLFHDGHFEAGNAVITEPGVTFSIAALHASPHSFRKFSTAFMGKGEGAQAYGWGLYFATNPKVNRSYMNQFAQDKATWRFREVETAAIEEMQRALVGSFLPKDALPEAKEDASDIAWSVLGDLVDAAKGSMTVSDIVMELHDEIDTNRKYAEEYPQEREKMVQLEGFLLSLLDHLDEIEARPGMPSNYKVELNVEDSELLGWDYVDETVLALLKDSPVEEVRYALERAERRADYRGENVSGKDVYQELFDAFWDGEDGTKQEAQKAASVSLLSSDIKGIRYADGYTRGKAEEEQTYNYVIFDGNDIKITAFADESTGGAWADYEDPTATFSVVAVDSSGSALKPEMFVTRPDGNPDWFTIPKRRGQAAMPVRLLVGKDMGEHKGYGLTHIAASRDLDGLWVQTTPERYLSSILANASELYLQGDREILKKKKKPSSWMVLQLVKEDGYYSIVTAHPVNNPNKKPQGKRIPFDGRFSSTPGKEATGVWGLEEKYSSGRLPSKGGALDKASQEAMTADRGYGYSLPPGARVVNINDVRLRFDDGRQMQAGSPVSTMSLALMDDGLDSAPPLKERVIQQLIGDVRTAVRRFNRVFAGNTGVEAAAREMGQAQALLGMMNKYAAKGYRPRLTAQMRYVEVYARMLESGKILSYGKLNSQELESLKEDLETELSDAVEISARGVAWEAAEGGLYGKHELERMETQARQEVRDTLVRDYAGRKLDEVVRDMLNQGAAQLEKQLKDEEMARIGKLLDFIRPRKDPKTGKLKKGLMNADAYRRVARITRMMEAPAEKKAEEMERLNVQLAGDDLAEADHDRISLELLDWSVYGALESMSLDAVRAAGESLRELVLAERNVWELRLEDEKRRLKKVAMDAVAVLGRADATKMRQMTEKEERTFRKFGIIGRHLMSFSQAMYAMSGMPGVMKDLARETLDAVADGHVALTAREKDINNRLAVFMKEELGLDTERQRADFIQGLKKTIKTGIVREKVKVHSLDLTVEEAQRWLSMSREERQAERVRMRDEAESKGWAVEAMVEEDDVLPLKEAVHSALNPSPRIDGKKGRKRERVQVRREFMEKQEPLEASADQLLNVILTYEQPFYAENARMNGYTPEVLDALRRKVGADALAYGYKMRDLLSESGVAEEFERREGVPFPAQTNYWMSRFHDASRISQNRDALDVEMGTGARYGMLIQRVDHRHEVDLSLGASNVFLAACTQQNNYLVMGRMTARWRRLLSNKEFAGALKQRLGDGLFSSLKQMIDLFDGAGVMEAVTQRTMGSLLGMIQNAHAVSVLSAALTTIAKQPSALMHAAVFKSPARVMKQLLLDRVGAGRISFAEMLRKPFFQARFKDDRVFVELMRMGANAKWTRMAGLARMGMQALEHVDVWSNCASMTALYNLTWQDLEKENRAAAVPMTEDQMEEICDRTVKNALELVGQPQRLTQRSMMAALGKNNLWVRMNCYMGGEMLNKVGMTAAIGEKSRAEGDGVVKRFGKKMLWLSTMSGVEQVILMLLDLMRGNGPDDDELPEWLVYNALTGLSGLGLLNTLPILGPTLEEVSGQLNKLITGKNKGFIKTGLLDDMLFNFRGWMRCVRKFSDADKMSGEEMALAIADTVRLGAAGTGLGRGVN